MLKGSAAMRQCIAIARYQDAWAKSGNGNAPRLPRIEDAKGQELITLLAVMYQNGRLTEQEARDMLAKHGF